MPNIKFTSMSTIDAQALWEGGQDAYGHIPEQHVSDGTGIPCRHCQEDVGAGEGFLILAHCPFPKTQPFAETGPIFLHAEPCERYPETQVTPTMFLRRDQFLLKGYGLDDRIVYGTGEITKSAEIDQKAESILSMDKVAYVHVRSALNNCFSVRIDLDA